MAEKVAKVGSPQVRTPNYRGMVDYRKWFNKKHPELKIKPSTYKSIVSEFNFAVREKMIMEGFEFFPFGIGCIAIYKNKPKIVKRPDGTFNLPVNWKKTWEMWAANPKLKEENKRVYHMNDATDGYIAKITWMRFKRLNKIDNMLLYTFDPVVRFSWYVYLAITQHNSMDYYFENINNHAD